MVTAFLEEFPFANLAPRKPYPLTTVELQKAASRILKLTPKKILDVSCRIGIVLLQDHR